MTEINNLSDLADRIGFDAIDSEIITWIESGEFDRAVRERAKALGWSSPHPTFWALQQNNHQAQGHILNGPYGWEFCKECNPRKLTNEIR